MAETFVGVWKTQDPGFRYGFAGVTEFGGYLYQFGGNDDAAGAPAATDCYISSARINADGSLGPATVVGSTLVPASNAQFLRLDDYVFITGGNGTGAGAAVSRLRLERSGGVSKAAACVPVSRIISGTTAGLGMPMQGRFGYTIAGAAGLAVLKADIQGLGTVTDISPPPLASLSTTMVIYRDNLVLIGGFASAAVQSAIWACKICGTSAGPWRQVGEMPVAARRFVACIAGSRLIVCGGIDAGFATALANVYSAQLDSDANIVGSIVTEPPLVSITSGAGICCTDRYMYVVGGQPGSLAGNNLNVAQYIKFAR